MSETPAAEVTDLNPRPGVTVVTQENFAAYVDDKLGITPADETFETSETSGENADPDAEAKAELVKVEAEKAARLKLEAQPKEGDEDGNKVFFKGKWTGKNDFGYRLHVKETQIQKDAEAKVAAAEERANAAREEAEKAARDAAELRTKYEPPKSADPLPEPKADDYQDMASFLKARDAWVKDATLREVESKSAEAQAKAANEAATKRWNDRAAELKKELGDEAYAKIEATQVPLSEQAVEAVRASELGPRIMAHFVQNPDEAVALGKLTVGGMLKALGRLEAKLEGIAKLTAAAVETKPVAEISKAPAPISPIKAPSNPGTGLKIDAAGNWTGTYEEFKAADQAGKFK